MREARRLALLRRQSLIAEVSRKQALRSLAEALEAEARGQALAARSLRLVAASAAREGATTGAALAQRAAFTAGLAQLAANAGDAARDAVRQRDWQAEALARTETRAKRLAEMSDEALRTLAAAQERRAAGRDMPLARKLQSRRDD
ncbi:MAG: hypothetical protein NBV68_16190 [Erythrobacter sp.]|uniref:hypothetical protein n=1 Tax=Erythrobacter sp. TaxID=1042 RepID=UPI0025CDB5C2|nr:hypothetical protein [Erythrobacter sp.]MCM0000920.1 hypothetical protein [Erythrobacter sp.]